MLKISGISLISIMALLFITPYLFPGTISNKIKYFTKTSVISKVEIKTTIKIKNFPSIACDGGVARAA